jgi:hypothetical protein
VKIFLNFENIKKAMSKLFLKFLINFMPKTLCKCENRIRFFPLLCDATEYILGGGGGRGDEKPAFLNSLHAHIRSGTKGASAIGPQLWREVVSTGGRGQKSPFSSGLFSPHAVWCTVPKLPP